MGNTTPFDKNKYLQIQKEKIIERINFFGGRLYLEFGGKLFDDLHAERVLPGFKKDSKLELLLSLRDEMEMIMVISAQDITNRKMRSDINITYDVEVERLIVAYQRAGIQVNSVVLSFYEPHPEVNKFIRKLKNRKINVYKHYKIAGYPRNIPLIVSEQGLGKNEYIPTEKPLVLVTAPGPGSGKMATCLSQLYHESKRNIKSGYAKYETFPVWNLPLTHPVNMAYEAATVDLFDVNMIDPYHLEAYGVTAVNYNRDVETFPLLKDLFTSLLGECPYKSPTDMGVNMVGFAIRDEAAIIKAAQLEIVRRYQRTQKDFFLGEIDEGPLEKAEMLLKRSDLHLELRECVKAANNKANKIEAPVIAIQLHDGEIVTGKRSSLFTSSAAVLLNALKHLAGIDDKLILLSRQVIEPIIKLKTENLHNHSPKIHGEEILIALAIQANTNPLAELCLSKIEELNGCEAHSSCLLDFADLKTFGKLGVRMTEEPQSYTYKRT